MLLTAATFMTVGCVSGGPVPADKLARSQAAIRSAQEIGAERNAQGVHHLQTAKKELAEGRKHVIDGDQEKAVPLLLKAEADAELAMNLTREATAIASAQKTQEEVRALQSSMAGTTTTDDGAMMKGGQ